MGTKLVLNIKRTEGIKNLLLVIYRGTKMEWSV